MATKFTESRLDHRGDLLPLCVYALVDPQGAVVSYKARWREPDDTGVPRQRSRSFSRVDHASLDRARAAAVAHRQAARDIVRIGETVLRADAAARLSLGELFKEWIANHAAQNTGERYVEGVGDRRVDRAAGLVLRAEHEVVEQQLRSAGEEPRERPGAVLGLQCVFPVDAHPRKRHALTR